MPAQGHLFSEREMRVLAAVCDTLAPSLAVTPDPAGLYARRASQLGVPARLAEALELVASPTQQALVRLALFTLDQPLANAALGGVLRPFLDMTLDERTAILHNWAESRLEIRRRAFQGFKRLALFFFYALLDDSGCNPNWAAIGYPGPKPAPASTARKIKPLTLLSDATLETDVVIVGSGAGGGVVAGELSAAGLDVVVLEKGGYHAEADFDGRELSSTARMFENRGLLATADLGVAILAGSTLGGGTTVNWCAALRPPESVLQEWEREYGVSGYAGKEYQQALNAVSKRINVTEQWSQANAQNTRLAQGSEALSYAVKTIPRNVKGCNVDACGFCNFGCPQGAKLSTLRTYLQDAHDQGARIVVNADVERVLTASGRAVGVLATAQAADGRPVRLTVRARAVVAAAGSLHTPALLMRSGLTNANIGRNLHLHPTSVTYGIHAEPVCGWSGPILSRMVSQFSDLSSDGYGVALETAPIHPGIAASVLSWQDGRQHKDVMRQLDHLSNIIIITRDREGGRIALDRRGQPVIHYTLSKVDGAHLMRGILESLRIHRAAGALEVCGPHTWPRVHRPEQDGGESAFADYLRGIQAAGLRKNDFALLSAHQMSSCRMGGNPALGAIDPTGETFEVENLYVADGSTLPTASGVNPMLTIMGVAHLVAQHIKARLVN